MADQQAGWYSDPSGDVSKLRYWDGSQWTNDFTDALSVAQPEVQPEVQPAAIPVASVEPMQPASEPMQPTLEPMQPGSEPMQPVMPVQPVQPAQPVQPVQPTQAQPYQAPQPPQAPQYPGQIQGAPAGYGQPQQKKSKAPLIIVISIVGLIVIGVALLAVAIMAFENTSNTDSNPPITIVEPIEDDGDNNGNDSGSNDNGNNNNSSNGGSNSNNSTTPSTPSDIISGGDITGEIGREYSTKWFDFTVNSMRVSSSIPEHTASAGNVLVIANITITNTFGSLQPFGTFDWLVDSSSLSDYIWPMDPLNSSMMPESYNIDDGETVTYDVVVEIPDDLDNPFFMYIELDEKGQQFTTFKIPIEY
ncbi:MAG: DUF2510 domain-containing protein [Coriobacteriia bacterium]|nr:DUF2510 domain-containing protein [Coriobacteriia bacterium]